MAGYAMAVAAGTILAVGCPSAGSSPGVASMLCAKASAPANVDEGVIREPSDVPAEQG